MDRQEAMLIIKHNMKNSTEVVDAYFEAKILAGLSKENCENGYFESNLDGQNYPVNDACAVIWGGSPCLFTHDQALKCEEEGVCERIVKTYNGKLI